MSSIAFLKETMLSELLSEFRPVNVLKSPFAALATEDPISVTNPFTTLAAEDPIPVENPSSLRTRDWVLKYALM